MTRLPEDEINIENKNKQNENIQDDDARETENREYGENKKNIEESDYYDDPVKMFEQRKQKQEQARIAEEENRENKENKEKNSENLEKTNQSENVQTDIVSPASPVVEKKQGIKTWINRGMYIVGGILLVVFIIAIFTGGNKQKKVTSKDTGANEQVAAPTVQTQVSDNNNLPLNNQQIANLKRADFNLKNNNQSQQEAMMEAAKAAEMRMSAPSNVISNSNLSSNGLSANNSKNNAVLGGDGSGDGNTAFMAKVSASSAPIAKATRILHLSTTLAQGNIIQATLDTRIASDLPGMVRAVTSSDIYSEDQSTLLIPRGSRLIGQYTNRIQQGQNRIFVVWQRLIRPDGIDIQIASPGTDTLGTAGLAADSIDHHFFQQFGTAILLSVIGAGAASVGVNSGDQYNSATAYRQAIAGSFNQTAKQTLQNTGEIPPTLYVNQGTKITVFIARDLDFYDALNGGRQDDSQSTGSLFQGKLS